MVTKSPAEDPIIIRESELINHKYIMDGFGELRQHRPGETGTLPSHRWYSKPKNGLKGAVADGVGGIMRMLRDTLMFRESPRWSCWHVMLGKQRKGQHQRKPLFKAGRRVSEFILTGGRKLECMGKLSYCEYLPGTLEQLSITKYGESDFWNLSEIVKYPSQRLVLDTLNEGFNQT